MTLKEITRSRPFQKVRLIKGALKMKACFHFCEFYKVQSLEICLEVDVDETILKIALKV